VWVMAGHAAVCGSWQAMPLCPLHTHNGMACHDRARPTQGGVPLEVSSPEGLARLLLRSGPSTVTRWARSGHVAVTRWPGSRRYWPGFGSWLSPAGGSSRAGPAGDSDQPLSLVRPAMATEGEAEPDGPNRMGRHAMATCGTRVDAPTRMLVHGHEAGPAPRAVW
jgi:hypothetical protein